MRRPLPLAAGLALAAATVWAPSAGAGLPVNEAACGNGKYFTWTLRVDRDRLKTHKNDRRLVEVIFKNPCAGYASIVWGYNPAGGDHRRVMLVVAPGVKGNLKAADLDRFKIPRKFQWSGGGGGGGLADYTCQRPSHLVTKDKKDKIKVVPYHPDSSRCPK